MSLEQARNDIVRILDSQTIKKVRSECEALASEKDLPTFEEFLQTDSHFIVTNKRARILNGVHDGLAAKDSPGVILHGAYGSGKTVIMESIAQLCQKSHSYDGYDFDQLTYGDIPIDCLQISLEQNDTPTAFLQAIFESLADSADTVTRDEFIEHFNKNKIDLTIEDLDTELQGEHRQDLIDRFNDPASLEDIARVTKSLTAGDAHAPIAWFASHYRDQEGQYPAIYIDEFEQLFRQGVAVGEPTRLKAIVQRMIRKAVSGFEDMANPPYVLFANTLSLDKLREEFNAERDLTKRINDSVSYNIDLSQEETKELFTKLYRLYLVPLLADRSDEVADWSETITTAAADEDGYVYPFTEEALDFALHVIHTWEGENTDEPVVEAFRDYKYILISFLRHWEGDNRIDREFLYQHGDAVRNELRGRVEEVDLDALPGANSIETTITNEYDAASGPERRVLSQVAKVGILERTERPVYFTADEIQDIAAAIEIRMTATEATNLIQTASNGPAYFEIEDDRLVFDPDSLTGKASEEEEQSLPEQIRETVDALNLNQKDLIELWEDMLDHQFRSSFEITNYNDQYLEFDTENDLNYTNKIYFTVAEHELPEQLQGEVDDDALNIVIRLGANDDEDSDLPAQYVVTERNSRAMDLCDGIQKSLNSHIESHIDDDSNMYLLEKIDECYPDLSDYHQYLIFLKLSLGQLAGDDLPEDIRDRVAERTSFDLYQTVSTNVSGTNAINNFARVQLGLTGKYNQNYSGGDILDLVYGIKYLDQENELIYENPNLPHIDVRSFGQTYRGRSSGPGFEEVVAEFSEHESFVDETADGTYDLVPRFSTQTSTVLDIVEDAVIDADDGLEFDEVVTLVFGTGEVDSVTKTMLYLLLVLGELWDDQYSWVFDDDDDSRIVAASSQLATQQQQAHKTLADAISIKILDQAKQDDPETEAIHELKQQYDQVAGVDGFDELDDLTEDVDADWNFDYEQTEQKLRDIVANPIFEETPVAEYANAVRPLSEIERELLYLIHEDLEHVVTQVEAAAEVLNVKQYVVSFATKLAYFDIEPDIQSANLTIQCIEQIEDYWASHQQHQLDRTINQADIAGEIDDYLDDDYDLDRLLEVLNGEIRSIVPDVDAYDNEVDFNTVTSDRDHLKAELSVALEDELETVYEALAMLETYEDRMPEGETNWIRHGRTQLNNCRGELEKDPSRFDYEDYDDYWEQWQNAKDRIEDYAFDDDKFEDAVRQYDSSVDIDIIIDATEDDIADLLVNLPKDTFTAIIKNLDGDAACEDLKHSLLKVRARNELMGSSDNT